MMKILMVCLGNICRSPMAQGILEKKIKDNNLDHLVDSAGTSDYHVGESPDNRAIETGRKQMVDLSSYKGRQFSQADFSNFDLIFVMDGANLSDVLKMARNDSDRKKVDLILNRLYPGDNRSVPDPYYGGEQDFDMVFELLDKACDKIVEELIYER